MEEEEKDSNWNDSQIIPSFSNVYFLLYAGNKISSNE